MGRGKDCIKRHWKKVVVPLVFLTALSASGNVSKGDRVDIGRNNAPVLLFEKSSPSRCFGEIVKRFFSGSEAFAEDKLVEPPGAICADRDRAIKKAYEVWANNLTDPFDSQLGGYNAAVRMMNMENGAVRFAEGKVSPASQQYSFAYSWLHEKLNMNDGYYSNDPKPDAMLPGACYWSIGYSRWREGDVGTARLAFAKGIFTGAHLNQSDFNRISKALPNITYDPSKGDFENCQKLGVIFADNQTSLNDKELILKTGIMPKFQHLKKLVNSKGIEDFPYTINDKAGNVIGPSIEQQCKTVYWNLGGYVVMEVALGNSNNIAPLTKDNNGLYKSLKSKFNYSTASPELFD